MLPANLHGIRRSALLLAFCALLPPSGSLAAAPLPYEVGVAERETGRTRALLERLAKENVLYQLHLAGQSKQDLHDTSGEIDRLLMLLAEGSSAYSVAPPPTDAIREQIERVDDQWGLLRRIALASPYDYLRRADEFLPQQNRFGDPLRIRGFDRKAGQIIDEIAKLMALYNVECKKSDYPLCAVSATSGLPTMLLERMIKLMVFVYAGIDADNSATRLRESRDAFEANHTAFRKSSLMRDATLPEAGKSGEFVSQLFDSIDADWRRLEIEIRPAIGRHVEEIDIQRAIKVQAQLVDEIERFTAALARFASQKFGN